MRDKSNTEKSLSALMRSGGKNYLAGYVMEVVRELAAAQTNCEASNRIYAKCLLAMSAAREYPDFDGTDTPITRMLDDAINEVTAAINAAQEITK